MQIFSIKNNFELMDVVIDLHGLHYHEAAHIVKIRLRQIQVDLNKGTLQPNIDSNNHVLKIVCGRGSHSVNPVLKIKIPKLLVIYFLYFIFDSIGGKRL
jgi:hypothetical protein